MPHRLPPIPLFIKTHHVGGAVHGRPDRPGHAGWNDPPDVGPTKPKPARSPAGSDPAPEPSVSKSKATRGPAQPAPATKGTASSTASAPSPTGTPPSVGSHYQWADDQDDGVVQEIVATTPPSTPDAGPAAGAGDGGAVPMAALLAVAASLAVIVVLVRAVNRWRSPRAASFPLTDEEWRERMNPRPSSGPVRRPVAGRDAGLALAEPVTAEATERQRLTEVHLREQFAAELEDAKQAARRKGFAEGYVAGWKKRLSERGEGSPG